MDLDLIILGGYHGQGRKRDLISMFLVGVALPISENGKPRQEFYSFARVGSGFSDSQLLELLHKLNPHWQKWDKNAPPSMIHCGKEKPDVWIDPKQSAILQVFFPVMLNVLYGKVAFLIICRSKHLRLLLAILIKLAAPYGFPECNVYEKTELGTRP